MSIHVVAIASGVSDDHVDAATAAAGTFSEHLLLGWLRGMALVGLLRLRAHHHMGPGPGSMSGTPVQPSLPTNRLFFSITPSFISNIHTHGWLDTSYGWYSKDERSNNNDNSLNMPDCAMPALNSTRPNTRLCNI